MRHSICCDRENRNSNNLKGAIMAKLIQDLSIGGNLRKLREARGLTQEDVCARMAQLGRPMLQSAYSQIETGRRNLFVSDLIALRTVLNAQYDDFFRGLVPIDRYKDETQT